MRALFHLMLCSAFSLTTVSLLAQATNIDLSLDLKPGETYQLKVQQEHQFHKTPQQVEDERKRRRYTPKYRQSTRTYDLTVNERRGDSYRITLVRTLVQTYSNFERASTMVSEYNSNLNSELASRYKDTVNFEIDKYGAVTQLEMPDSTASGYVIPDTFQINMQPVMPELVKDFITLLDYFPKNPVKVGDSWTSPVGATYTLQGKYHDLWHLRQSNGKDIYLDPQTYWVNFGALHQFELAGPEKSFASTVDFHQFIRGGLATFSKPVRIKGNAPEHKNGSLLLRLTPYYMGKDKEYLIPVDANGYFEWQDTLQKSGFFQLTDLYGTDFWGYFSPEDTLQLNWSNEPKGWDVQGNSSEECKYLNQFFTSFPKYELFLHYGGDRHFIGSYEPDLDQFWSDRDQDTQAALRTLSEWNQSLSPEFIALQKRQIEYLRASALTLNLSYHLIRLIEDPDNNPSVPEYYESYLNDRVLHNEISRSIPAFRALLHLNLQRHMFNTISGDLTHILSRSYESAYYYAQLHYQKYPLHQTTYDLLLMSMNWSGYTNQVDHLFRHFQEINKDQSQTGVLTTQYQHLEQLRTPGRKLPDLRVYDENDEPVQLSDLKGSPTVLIVVKGHNYWERILQIESTAKLFPEIQFVFLYLGKSEEYDQEIPEGKNLHQLYTKTNSAEAVKLFGQYSLGRHPRAYLINRRGEIANTLLGNERYDDEIIKTLQDLQKGEPLIDKQTQKGIFLIVIGLLIGGLIIGFIIHQWQRRLRHREQFHRQQVESKLQAIRSQLNPHFMFNSMSSIQHLIRSGQSGLAQSYLGKLATLLRASLRHTRENFISLKEELEVIGQYCELEALRFKFSYELEIDQQLDTRAISIPPLLLQPYVENAVLHGIAPLRERGKLRVNISEQGRQLWIRIRDNGQGLKASGHGPKQGNGIGLALNAERLRLVYGDAAKVNIYSPSPANGKDLGTGTEVQIAMPIDV